MCKIESGAARLFYPIELHSGLVNLRTVRASDCERLFDSYFKSFEAARFLRRAPHSSLLQTQDVLQKWCVEGSLFNESNFGWVISDTKNDLPVGVLYVMLDGFSAEVHYGIGVAFWNQGFATEAVKLATNWLLSHDSVRRVWTAVDCEHIKTRRVLEKAGFEQDCVLASCSIIPALSEKTARDAIIYRRLKL